MKRFSFQTLCIGFVLVCMLGIGISVIAIGQQDASPKYTILVLGRLHLTPKGDAETAEKLMVEKLLPAAKRIEGLKITALKRVQMPGPSSQMRTKQPDFIMMAEVSDLTVLAKLWAAPTDDLEEYGKQMKIQAGAPKFEVYQILEGSADGVE
ncbi:MAG: hypothetical protein OXP71_00265 [Candidatus Poribacteria bacterium]|nr:hypothetical protein [Candidatus Poribacteria bacterium]